jgi:integrase/recombinase XerD
VEICFRFQDTICREVGTEQKHPWRGADRCALLRSDRVKGGAGFHVVPARHYIMQVTRSSAGRCYFDSDTMNRMGNSVRIVNRNLDAPSDQAHGGLSGTSLIYDRAGNRKYLTAAERTAFLHSVDTLSPEVRTFCRVLAYTGARISECLALTTGRIDASAKLVVLESLKKRRRGVFRAIPLPDDLLAELEHVHRLSARRHGQNARDLTLWPWCRTFAWMRVKEGMSLARVEGPQATPKGLRHAFAVSALQSGIPINLVRRWLGHSRLSTTEIYADAIGPEERAIADRLWKSF